MKKWLCLALCVLLTGCADQDSIAGPQAETTMTAETTAAASLTDPPRTTGHTTEQTTEYTTEQTAAQTTSQTEQTTSQTDPASGTDNSIQAMFDSALSGVQTELLPEQIIQRGTVNGTAFTLTVDLQKWDQLTSMPQIVQLTALFWECYPRMYARFHDLSDPPVDITLAIENDGYEVASTDGLTVHLHDNWLHEHPEDYDCITHELAHVIQAGWDGDFLEYSDYIERFADCCRYEYAMQNGIYNDAVWSLQTVLTETTREQSVRFLVWLDHTYSDEQTDFLRRYFRVCHDMQYPAAEWEAAWQAIFAETALAGKTADEVWEMYSLSDFEYLSAEAASGEASDLLEAYPIRQRLRDAENAARS